MTSKKAFIAVIFNASQDFIAFLNLLDNLMYELAVNGLKIEILSYSAFIYSIAQADSSLIQLSVLQKLSSKDHINYCFNCRIKINRSKFCLYFLCVLLIKISLLFDN